MEDKKRGEEEQDIKDWICEIKAMSFETALARLEQIVSDLEHGETALEESIQLYEKGSLLKAHCEERLAKAQMRIDKVIVKEGKTVLEAMEADSEES